MLNRHDTVTMKPKKNKALAGLKSKKGKYISGQKVRLRQKKLTDVRNDYNWQSDPELARLDAAPVLKASFPVYLMDYVEIIHKPERNRYPLAIETLDGKHIGNCTCYDIDEKKSEAGAVSDVLALMCLDSQGVAFGFGSVDLLGIVHQIDGKRCLEHRRGIELGQFGVRLPVKVVADIGQLLAA